MPDTNRVKSELELALSNAKSPTLTLNDEDRKIPNFFGEPSLSDTSVDDIYRCRHIWKLASKSSSSVN